MPLAKLGTSSTPPAPVSPARQEAARSLTAVKKLQLRLQPDAWKRIKALALDEDASLEQLGIEAFSLLFERRGLPPLESSP
jgi:hypothetical protein